METDLQGIKGSKTMYLDSLGRILDVIEEKDPLTGNDVCLTINHDLQIGIYHLIEQNLAGILIDKLENSKVYNLYQKNLEKIFSEELSKIVNNLKINKDDFGLIVGLGNPKSTPDSLGPLTINNILVTNHLYLLDELDKGFRRVSAISPGVTGQTGLETSDLIKGVVDIFKPNFLIIIDALASQSVERLNKTIQITDTGIHPGSGVGNSRKEISYDTLNIPCIAIGVPTVLDAVTIVSDTINYMYKHYTYSKNNKDNPMNKLMIGNPNYLNKNVEVNKEDKKQLLGIVGTLEDSEVRELLLEVLTPIGYNMMVTQKEVDFLMEKLSLIIANGINMTLHDRVDKK